MTKFPELPVIPGVLVFDVNETLVDIDSLTTIFVDIFGDGRVLREWFAQLILYSMTATFSENYADFPTLAQGVLRMLGSIYQIDITAGHLTRLKQGLLSMPPHPDAAEGLTALRDAGFRLVTLTNSPPNPNGPTALQNSGLADFFEHQLSVDSCRAFKPSPMVYRYVCETLGVVPAQCMMVAAHVWDTLGAQGVGFSSALVARPGNAPLPVAGLPPPHLVVRDIRQLAQRLLDARGDNQTVPADDGFHPDFDQTATDIATDIATDATAARVHHVKASDLSSDTAQSDGLRRFAALSGRSVGTEKLWMGETHASPQAASANHHHGEAETAIYVRSGNPHFVFHDGVQEVRIVTEPGDYVFIPPYLPHREENPDPNMPAEVVIARSTQEAIVVNLRELYPLGGPH